MAKNVSMVRQITSVAQQWIGYVSQLIVDTGLNVIRVHDGQTRGGFIMLGAANNLSELASAATARGNLGVDVAGTAATLAAIAQTNSEAYTDVETARAIAAEALKLTKTANLGDVANAVAALGNLGISIGSNGAFGGSINIGGVILKWGLDGTITTTTVINFPVAFPNNCVAAFACMDSAAPNYCAVTITDKTQMTIYKSNTSFTFWFAIGN